MTNSNTKSLLIILFLYLFSFSGYSQNMDIKGTVYDTSGIIPLPNAIVMAVRVKDSLLLGFSHTNKEGTFALNNFLVDTFSLIISYPRCDDKTYYILGNSKNFEINIASIKMLPKSTQLEEIIIYANRNPIFYRGDTLVYVADSFKVGPNAVVEDLLRKLPGIKVDKDGKLKSQGKEISQVLVDGDEFFGGDATIATKNLAADGVKSVEVYEKKDATGGEESTQVLNLTLKEEAKKGYFGRSSIASDFQNFYQGELLANKFNGTQKISVFALSSNTPRSSFDWGDQNKFGLDNESEIVYDEEGNGTWTRYSQDGIPKTFKAGVYFSDKIGKKKKTKIGFNYTFNDSRINSVSSESSQYFLTDTTYFTNDSTHNYSLNQSHLFGVTFNSQIDSLTTISFSPKLTYSIGNADDFSNTNFLESNSKLNRGTQIETKNDSQGLSFVNETRIDRNFKKPKRNLYLTYSVNSKLNNTKGNMKSVNSFYDGVGQNDTIDQQKLNQNNTQNHTGRIIYTEPLTKKLNLSVEYLYEYGLTSQNKETRNKLNGDYTFIDTNYSNDYGSIRHQHRIGSSFTYKMKKITCEAGMRYRNIDILNKNNINNETINQNLSNFLPKGAFIYNPSNNKRFSIRYTTSTEQPKISSIQPIRDNSNPNRVVTGNASLKPSYKHTFNMHFNNWQSLSGRYIYTGSSFNITNNDFANSTTYDPIIIGKTISKTENVNGNMDGYLYGGFGIPLFKKVVEISPNINANYRKNSNFINGLMNTTQTRTISGSLNVSFTKDSIRFSVNADLEYSSPKSTISSVSSQPYTTKSFSADIVWTLPWKMKILMDGKYTMNEQRTTGYNINYFIWNAEINRSFLKTENLILSVIGNDILNQNISARRSVYENVITDNKTQIISRYFLVKLTMKFNNNKTKEDDENDEW